MRIVDEIAHTTGWIAEERMARTSHALEVDGRVWLFDVVDWPELDDRVRELGEPAGVVQLLDRHNRDCAAVARRLGVAGYTAKGVAYGIAGLLLLTAAINYDPDRSRGLDGALHTLREQSYGGILLTLMALGIAAFAVFCLVQAKYRKV